MLQKIENADLLVVGTPISKGSYTGLLKHLLDLLTGSRSEGAVAIIAATDTGDCNSLSLEHSLRPLLSLLGYGAAPTAVFARNDDFVGFHLAEESVIIRARRAVREAFRMIGLELPLTTLIASDASLAQLDGVRYRRRCIDIGHVLIIDAPAALGSR